MAFEFQSRRDTGEIGVKRDVRKHRYQVARAVDSNSISFANQEDPHENQLRLLWLPL